MPLFKKKGTGVGQKKDKGSAFTLLSGVVKGAMKIPKKIKQLLGKASSVLSIFSHKKEVVRNDLDMEDLDEEMLDEAIEERIPDDIKKIHEDIKSNPYHHDEVLEIYEKSMSKKAFKPLLEYIQEDIEFDELVDQFLNNKDIPMVSTYNVFSNKFVHHSTVYLKNKYTDVALKQNLVIIKGNDYTKELKAGDSTPEQLKAWANLQVNKAKISANNINSGITYGKVIPFLHAQMYDGFLWRTKRDNKVREAHKKMEGKIISYRQPHKKGGGFDKSLYSDIYNRYVFPSEEPNCRCIAIPIKK